MKKLLCILVVFLQAFASSGQLYQSIFGVDSTVWYVHSTYGELTVHNRFVISGDTAVGSSMIYKKISGYYGSMPPHHELIREERVTGRVYSRTYADSSETLLMDMSLGMNDIFLSGLWEDTLHVASITQLNGKKMIVLNRGQYYAMHFEEGLGPSNLNPLFASDMNMMSPLVCVYQDSALVGHSVGCDVGIWGGSSEAILLNELSIFPNPASGAVQVVLPVRVREGDFSICNMTGQTVAFAQHFNGHGFMCDLSEQPGGFYFLEVRTDGKVWRAKLMRE